MKAFSILTLLSPAFMTGRAVLLCGIFKLREVIAENHFNSRMGGTIAVFGDNHLCQV